MNATKQKSNGKRMAIVTPMMWLSILGDWILRARALGLRVSMRTTETSITIVIDGATMRDRRLVTVDDVPQAPAPVATIPAPVATTEVPHAPAA